jgi:dipeptidyl aminopeptidase/acylaminoacyl peptidase
LTSDGTADDAYGGPFLWSPDGRYAVAWQTRAAPEREVHLIESSPRDQLQPKLHTFSYAKPGDPLPQRRPRIVSLDGRRVAPLAAELERILSDKTWSLDGPRWRPDSAEFTFTHHERGHQWTRVFAVTPATGAFRVVIEERSPTFFDYAHKQFLHWLDQTNEALWMSERDGHNHLYLYDTARGIVKGQITRGNWVVRGVERVDESKRELWLRVGGLDPEQDPYHVHLVRVGFDGGGLTRLTRSDGTHRWRFSPDGRFLIATWSRVDQPPVVELRRVDTGDLVCELERADASRLMETGWLLPERFVAKGRDGQTDIHGVVIRPTNFDAAKRWPIVEQIYAGPQSAYVPKEWGTQSGPRQIAELGFVVVMIDGMGTSHRGKAFHDVCHKNLGDAGFPDRIAWIRALATKYPELDPSRVGLYGGSAGGQNAVRGLIAHGDFYRVAVADCGCHDNRMDKVWWNELWMGWPVGPHFEEQSNATQAHRLSGRLLLIVGELDRNVDPASTMQVVDALVRADKDFDLLVIPGAGHGAAETPYGRRRRADFLVRHLLGVEPRRE